MAKPENPQANRLYESLLQHISEEAAERIANVMPLPKVPTAQKSFAWAESVCAGLAKSFDLETVKKVRMDCACGPGAGKIEKLRRLYKSAVGLADFAEKANALQGGYTILHEDGALTLEYPECYCACVKKVDKPISAAWCYCTLGYTKRMFAGVLGREVGVELLESVKTGGTCCRIKIV